MSNESSRREAVREQREALGFLSLFSCFQNEGLFLAHMRFEFLGQACLRLRTAKGKPGQDTIRSVLTLRHWLFSCWERKSRKRNTHVCSQEFTLLNKDSADSHRFLSLWFTGCSSSFSAPTKAAVSKHHLSDSSGSPDCSAPDECCTPYACLQAHSGSLKSSQTASQAQGNPTPTRAV